MTATFTPSMTMTPTFVCGQVVISQISPNGDTKIYFDIYNGSAFPVTINGIYVWWFEHGNGANLNSIVMVPATAPLSTTLWTGTLYDAYLITSFDVNADLSIDPNQTKRMTLTYSSKKHSMDRVTLYFDNLCSSNTP